MPRSIWSFEPKRANSFVSRFDNLIAFSCPSPRLCLVAIHPGGLDFGQRPQGQRRHPVERVAVQHLADRLRASPPRRPSARRPRCGTRAGRSRPCRWPACGPWAVRCRGPRASRILLLACCSSSSVMPSLLHLAAARRRTIARLSCGLVRLAAERRVERAGPFVFVEAGVGGVGQAGIDQGPVEPAAGVVADDHGQQCRRRGAAASRPAGPGEIRKTCSCATFSLVITWKPPEPAVSRMSCRGRPGPSASRRSASRPAPTSCGQSKLPAAATVMFGAT